jgi:hypothetical protein
MGAVYEFKPTVSNVELKVESGLINPTCNVFVSFLQEEYSSAKALTNRIRFLIVVLILVLNLQ